MNEKTKRIFLKSCPICGSAPRLHTRRCDPWGDHVYIDNFYYQCSGCGYVISRGVDEGKREDGLTTEDAAKIEWNGIVDDIVDMIKERYC